MGEINSKEEARNFYINYEFQQDAQSYIYFLNQQYKTMKTLSGASKVLDKLAKDFTSINFPFFKTENCGLEYHIYCGDLITAGTKYLTSTCEDAIYVRRELSFRNDILRLDDIYQQKKEKDGEEISEDLVLVSYAYDGANIIKFVVEKLAKPIHK